jgi:hypothetical protein
MTRSPKLKRTDNRDQNIEDKRGWSNRRRFDSEQGHRGDVTGRAGMPDRRIEERDHSDRQKKKNELCGIHRKSSVAAVYDRRIISAARTGRGGRRGNRLFTKFGA